MILLSLFSLSLNNDAKYINIYISFLHVYTHKFFPIYISNNVVIISIIFILL